MNSLQLLQALQAAQERRAEPKATVAHVHLSDRPLVIAGYHLAGDPGAPLSLIWGTDRDREPNCIVVGEPRDRALRFRVIDRFGAALLEYLSKFETRSGDGFCIDAPQLVVPNLATAEWLSGIVGRFTRNLRTDGDPPAPASVPMMGKHLTFFADPMPGSSLVLVATDALIAHWQSGQLPSEDLNLAALLGWIDPAPGMDGPQSAAVGETLPPAGPGSDPGWDEEVLVGLVREWRARPDKTGRAAVRRELERELREQLTPAWANCWRAVDLLRTLPPGEHVTGRWKEDRRAWTAHLDRVAQGRAHFRNIPKPTGSAGQLEWLERRTKDLEREMALDDPLIMARAVAAGEALSGSVLEADPQRRTPNPNGGNSLWRPLIVVEPALEFTRPAETILFLSTDPRMELRLLPFEPGGPVRLEVLAGANTNQTIGRLPVIGSEVVLSPFSRSEYYQRSKVDDVPWTHQEPPGDSEVPR